MSATPGPFVADFYSTVPGAPRARVYSKTTEANVGLFYSFDDAVVAAAAMNQAEKASTAMAFHERPAPQPIGGLALFGRLVRAAVTQ